MFHKQGSLEKHEVLLQVLEALLPGSREFRPVLCNHRVQTGPTGRCYLDTDLVLNISKSQKCPEIEQTSLGVVVGPLSLKTFKYTVEDNSAVMLHILNHETDKVQSLKQLSLVKLKHDWIQFSSVTQLCLTLCDPMNCSTPGLHVHHQLPEFTQTHITSM